MSTIPEPYFVENTVGSTNLDLENPTRSNRPSISLPSVPEELANEEEDEEEAAAARAVANESHSLPPAVKKFSPEVVKELNTDKETLTLAQRYHLCRQCQQRLNEIDREHDPETSSWLGGQWRPASLRAIINSFVGPFLSLVVLQALTQYGPFTWSNGSFGAAAVVLFSFPHIAGAIPRHAILGQLLSGLVAFAFAYIIQDDSLNFLRVAFSVSVSTALMKAGGISYPPGGGTAFVLAQEPIIHWSTGITFQYLLFPLLTGTIVLLVFAIICNNLILKKRYPHAWM